MEQIYTNGAYARKNPTWGEEDSSWKANKIAAILEEKDIAPQRIAEVGCGTGGVIGTLLRNAPFVNATGIGYDIAPEAIAVAKKKENSRLQFVCNDFLSSEGEKYDLLLCVDVIEHIEDYMNFIKRLRGRAKFYVFHIPLDMHISGLLRKAHLEARAHVGHLHYFDRYTAIEALKDTGYTILDWRYTNGAEELIRIHPRTRTRMANVVRRSLRRIIGDDLVTQFVGGSSLLVLAD